MSEIIENISPTYNSILRNESKVKQGVFIGTASTGLVRMEWAVARFGQIIPCNWGYKHASNWMPNCAPLGYLVADAQNLIVRGFIQSDCEWLFFIEHDNILPPDCFLRMNDYMRRKEIPIVSGLYFTKTCPAEPLVYRGRGNNYYADWRIGDLVWVDAIPTGCCIIHRSIIELLWNESEEYMVGSPPQPTRRVFQQPERVWYDPEVGWDNSQGTSDMEFCSRVIVTKALERAGWGDIQKKQYPFLVDTNIFVGHIDENGQLYPSQTEKQRWMPTGRGDKEPAMAAKQEASPAGPDLGISVAEEVKSKEKIGG